MQISGFKKRSISDQTGILSYEFNITAPGGFCSGNFGVSGSNVFNFSINNGKVYDNSGRFISSYTPNQEFTISGQLGQSSYDTYIDDNLVELGQPINSGKYSWVYCSASPYLDFAANINGTIPNYSLPESGAYLNSGYVITGNVINLNPNIAFRIFDVSVNQVGAPYSITGFTTGDITATGNILITSSDEFNSDYLLPITLNTNFGEFDFTYFISGNSVINQDIYLSISPNITEIRDNTSQNYNVYFANFPSGAGISVSLEYLSGVTGNIYNFLQVVRSGFQQNLSGYISGIGTLTGYKTGVVSGLDPKTSIMETGLGSGYLSSDSLTATGLVTINYNQIVYGFGSGFVTTDYLASGATNLYYDSLIKITGSVISALGYNFAGTGNNPGIATGLVPTGTGYFLARPTGVFLLDSGFSPSDYISAYLSVPKVFEGVLSYDYRITGVGYATGSNITGIVKSDFPLIFEPGYFTFSKYFSGAVFGVGFNTGNFNPVQCLENQELPVSGILAGYYSWSGDLDCEENSNLPSIAITGFPTLMLQGTGTFESNKVIGIFPSGGFLSTENSISKSQGAFSRTEITHNGITTSGTGYFSGVFTACPTLNGIWRETVTNTTGFSGQYYSNQNKISELNYQCYLSGSGNIIPSASSVFDFRDSGVIDFQISGSGVKLYGFRGLADSIGGPKGVELYLFKGPDLIAIMDDYSNASDLTFYDKSLTSYYDVGAMIPLDSGKYRLIAFSKQLEESTISFTSALFSGCESDGYMRFAVTRAGGVRAPARVDVRNFYDSRDNIGLTALSGVNFIPNTGTLYWNISESGIKYFDVPIYDNAAFGNNHTFKISLSNVSGASYGTYQDTFGEILDNESYIVVTGDGFGQTGRMPNFICNPITEPINFTVPVFPPITDPTINIPCKCASNDFNNASGDGGFTVTCGSFSYAGSDVTNGWKYLGEFCNGGARCNIFYETTINDGACEIEARFVNANIFPSGFLVIDSVYSGIENIATGKRGSCSATAVFANVECSYGGNPNWTVSASGIRNKNSGVYSPNF